MSNDHLQLSFVTTDAQTERQLINIRCVAVFTLVWSDAPVFRLHYSRGSMMRLYRETV